ncbi:hypothetical protein LIER_32426 [Lithospermum erythrorhizon]|uniref:Uncharacterized protein n=1 Tax=Lithospermum erythrorhizon TaxID=34254 RepID=A0AAV3RVK1_LITER
MSTIVSATKWLKKEYGGCRLKSKGVKLAFSVTVSEILRARNVIEFNGAKVEPDAIIAKVKTCTYRVSCKLYPDCVFVPHFGAVVALEKPYFGVVDVLDEPLFGVAMNPRWCCVVNPFWGWMNPLFGVVFDVPLWLGYWSHGL